MGYICNNVYVPINSTASTITEQCIASWYLIDKQLLVSLYIFLTIGFFSLLWTLSAHLQTVQIHHTEINFSVLLRGWASSSKFAAIMNRPVQMGVSFVITSIFFLRCANYQVTKLDFNIMTCLYCISIVDDCIRFFKAKNKLNFAFSAYMIMESLCIGSHFVLGYGETIVLNGIATRTWLDLSVLRPIFIYRSFGEMADNFSSISRVWIMCRTAVNSTLLIVFAGGIMFFLETLGELSFFQDNGFAHLYQCEDGT